VSSSGRRMKQANRVRRTKGREPESSSHDQLESWGSEGGPMAQKLMAHAVARAQCALLKAHGGITKAALTRDVA
jgi:hypothetical protein